MPKCPIVNDQLLKQPILNQIELRSFFNGNQSKFTSCYGVIELARDNVTTTPKHVSLQSFRQPKNSSFDLSTSTLPPKFRDSKKKKIQSLYYPFERRVGSLRYYNGDGDENVIQKVTLHSFLNRSLRQMLTSVTTESPEIEFLVKDLVQPSQNAELLLYSKPFTRINILKSSIYVAQSIIKRAHPSPLTTEAFVLFFISLVSDHTQN